MNHLRFEFTAPGTVQTELLVAMLSEQGFEGFEETADSLLAFIPEDDFDAVAFAEVCSRFPEIGYVRTTVEPENWNAAWESGFEPVIIEDLVAVRAGFHAPVANVRHEIVITPKMSFGTGHHATTWMMVKAMMEIECRGRAVLDFGTGTGVLAILAEQLGAVKTDAIDIDEWSITNALENAAVNNSVSINIYQADKVPEAGSYDIILANINLNVILASLPAISKVLAAGGSLLLSGFLLDDQEVMEKALAEQGLGVKQQYRRGDWLCILANKA